MFVLHSSVLKQKSGIFILLTWDFCTLVCLAVNCFWTAIFLNQKIRHFLRQFSTVNQSWRFLTTSWDFWVLHFEHVFLTSPFWLFPSVFAEKTASQTFTLKVASKCFYWPTNPRRSSRWWRRWAGSEAAHSSLSSKPDRRQPDRFFSSTYLSLFLTYLFLSYSLWLFN